MIEKKSFWHNLKLILVFLSEIFHMKIGCDVRFFYDGSAYSVFVRQFLFDLIARHSEATFFLYTNEFLGTFQGNVIIRTYNFKRDNFIDDIKLSYEMKKDKLDLLICFDEFKPFFYHKDTIFFIPSLAHIFYGDESLGSLKKSWKNYSYQKNLRAAKKIICFDESTKDDLNERFNIAEKSLEVIKPFFVLDDLKKRDDSLTIDIKARHNLGMDYMIYSAGYGVDKNLERLIEVFDRIKEAGKDIALFVLGEEIGVDIDARRIVLEKNLNDRIFFQSNVKKEEEQFFFEQSLGVVYPVLYESFPFTLNKAIFYDTPIIASHISSVKDIFADMIDYFNPVSKVDMTKSILEFARKNIHTDYTQIRHGYSKDNFLQKLESVVFPK